MAYDKLLLASSSPRRQELLKSAKIPFEVTQHFFDEHNVPDKLSPEDFATYVAYKKADSIHNNFDFNNKYVLGVDTIVVFQNTILGKPTNAESAKNNILKMSGQWHKVISGISIINKEKNIFLKDCCISKVKFAILTDKFIDTYIQEEHWKGFAGGYAIQSIFSLVVEQIVGSYTNIVGLPMETLYRMLNTTDFKKKL